MTPDPGAAPAVPTWWARGWRKLRGWTAQLVWGPHFVKLVADLLFGLAVLVVFAHPPFGIEDAANQQASTVMQRVLSPFHTRLTNWGTDDKVRRETAAAPHITRGQQAITVVTIDEAYFRERTSVGADGRPVWPLPTRILVKGILADIIRAQPRAVFVDLAFPVAPREILPGKEADRGESMRALARDLIALRPSMPVLIGDVVDPDSVGLAEDQEGCGPIPYLAASALPDSRVTNPVLIADIGRTPNIHFVDLSMPAPAVGAYPLATRRLGPKGACRLHDEMSYLPSPALALFKIYAEQCAAFPHGPCADPRVARLAAGIRLDRRPGELLRYGVNGPAHADQLAGPLSLQWGTRLSPAMGSLLYRSEGADACAGQLASGEHDAIRIYFQNLFGRSDSGLAGRRCAFIDNISAAHVGPDVVLEGRGGQGIPAASLLRDRIVLVGVAIPQARDFATSPVNGDLPGVFLHAVALENLLSWGTDFRWQNSHPQWWPQLVVLIIAFGMRGGLSWMADRKARRLPRNRFRAPLRLVLGLLRYVLFPLALFLLVLLPAVALMLNLVDLPTAGIVGPIVLLHVAFFKAMSDIFKKLLGRLVEHYRGKRRPAGS